MPNPPRMAPLLDALDRNAVEQAIQTLIRFIGDDPTREGLRDTPARVMRAWVEDWGRGYKAGDPRDLLRLFDAEPEEQRGFRLNRPVDSMAQERPHQNYNQMIIVRDIALFSCCEHHLAPFFGVAHIAYIPTRKGIVGLSKLARVVDHFSRRLQVQERLTNQIAACLQEHLSPHIGIMIEATHLCMVSRGVMQPNARTITTALKGNIYDEASARSEFLEACRAKA